VTTSARQSLEQALSDPRFVDVTKYPAVRVDLRYSTTKNLLSRDVYGGYQRALLHREAAAKFQAACNALSRARPGWSFLVFDALRPQSAQEEFWNLVKNTPQEPYFAHPQKGSLHSYGFAIDLGLCDEKGAPLDMGTDFDDLTDLAQPRHEERLLAVGRLSQEQVENRRILRGLMEGAGFEQLPHEWWHYDALPGAEVRAKHTRLG